MTYKPTKMKFQVKKELKPRKTCIQHALLYTWKSKTKLLIGVEFMYLVNNQVAIQPRVDLQPNNKTTDNQQFVAVGFQKEEHV